MLYSTYVCNFEFDVDSKNGLRNLSYTVDPCIIADYNALVGTGIDVVECVFGWLETKCLFYMVSKCRNRFRRTCKFDFPILRSNYLNSRLTQLITVFHLYQEDYYFKLVDS